MKVCELIAELQKLPQKAKVYVASDEEGNTFGEVEEISEAGDYFGNKNGYIIWPGNTFTGD